jgi:hypothetical protein
MNRFPSGLAPLFLLLSGAAWMGCAESASPPAGGGSVAAPADAGGSPASDAAAAAGRVPANVAAILTMGCARMECHGNPGPGSYANAMSQFGRLAGMTLANGPCAGRPRMVRGKSAESLIIQKTQPDGPYPCGAKMPLGCNGTGAQRCLTPQEIATIAAWIDSGAPSE